MSNRIIFITITAFWVVMNVLLWREESRGGTSSQIPFQTVAQRLLESADTSTLQIRQRGASIGQFRWTPAVLHDAASATNQLVDEGMVLNRTGYAVDFDVNLLSGAAGLRGRGSGHLEFNADRSWRSLEFRFTEKPMTYEFSLGATNAQLNLHVRQGTDVIFNQVFPLNDPALLVSTLDGALGGFGLLTPGLLSGLGIFAGADRTNQTAAALPPNVFQWEARTAELRISQQKVRAYQITLRLLNRYQADVWVGRDGRVLRADLPEGIELRDENLSVIR